MSYIKDILEREIMENIHEKPKTCLVETFKIETTDSMYKLKNRRWCENQEGWLKGTERCSQCLNFIKNKEKS